jgi:hypothetical protein
MNRPDRSSRVLEVLAWALVLGAAAAGAGLLWYAFGLFRAA